MGKNYKMKAEKERPRCTICNEYANYDVTLEVRSRPGVASYKQVLWHVCEDHKDVKFNDLVSQDMWLALKQEFLKKKVMPPIRKYSNIIITKIK